MHSNKEILLKRAALIAAIYFALLGLFDIGMDIWHGTLSWFFLVFNLAFFIPLLFRRQPVYLFTGIVFTMLFGYLLLAGAALAFNGPGMMTIQRYGVAAMLFFSFACAITLIIAGLPVSSQQNELELNNQ